MFYDLQSSEQKEQYKQLLSNVGSLSNLFSESDAPYLAYRVHENIFCKIMNAENLARHDCSADAKSGNVGIGLKTWVGSNVQKVAEFNKLKKSFDGLNDYEIACKVAKYRNDRIEITKRIYGIETMLYHVVKREKGKMIIFEYPFELISIDDIQLIEKESDNCVYFSDGSHTYNFNKSKSTLYMSFDSMDKLDEFKVNITQDPYAFVQNIDVLIDEKEDDIDFKNAICLPLYSEKHGEKFVFEKSGLNQWNAAGRKRDPNEVYIPYQKLDRNLSAGFFPPRDTPFQLRLPDGRIISAKVCQQDGKAIMSNPNKALGEWLLRDVFKLSEGELLTYRILEKYNIDSVIIKKMEKNMYHIDFSSIGSYEKYLIKAKSSMI